MFIFLYINQLLIISYGRVLVKKTPSDQFITIGINSVLRALKHKRTKSVLLSTSIQPKFITTQILTFAISRNSEIKILLVPNLESIVQKITGISCLTVALINQEKSNSYTELNDWILHTSKKHEIPEILINKYVHKKYVDHEKKMEVDEPKINFNDLYLIKSDDKKREFIPGDHVTLSKTKSDWTDFISLSESVTVSKKLNSELKNHKSVTDTYVTPNKIIKLEVPIEKSLQDLVLPKQRIKKKTQKKNILENSTRKYFPLSVHKVKGNPNKKKKNK